MKGMERTLRIKIVFGILIILGSFRSYSQLKSMVYDFDGLDIGASDIPEGDYAYGDLSYQIAANPLSANDMLGDRVMKLSLNWNNAYGSFGRGISRFVEFDPNADMINFFFYNPTSNNQNATFDVMIGDDDDQNGVFENANDDVWKKSFSIPGSGAWQLYSVSLKDMVDNNPGGNGVFDIAFSGNKGKLMHVEFRFSKPNSSASNAVFYLDMINFTEGILPRGNTEFDLPYKSPSDYAVLGAFMAETPGQNQLIPQQFESLFPVENGRKIRYVNFFQSWSSGGTTPNNFPDGDVQTLITNGYMPIITWEPMFAGYDRLDPVQPRLNNIISGTYNSYIDAYADKLVQLNDTVIIRFMHEFEGNWYPWSISQNGGDPAKYKTAFQMVVDRFRARGATKVKWMWCVNSDYAPYESYNWVVNAYPGDTYVNFVATDIYNNHEPINLPWWKSFRWQATESYYYLTKYFPTKPLLICEVGCRERFSSENSASESKAAWYARMDKEMQSNFRKARALIFFNASHDQNWFVNTSPSALQSLVDNIWHDDYYFKVPLQSKFETGKEYGKGLYVYPNPSTGLVTINYTSNSLKMDYVVNIMNSEGKLIYKENVPVVTESFSKTVDVRSLPRGIYYVEMKARSTNAPEGEEIKEMAKLVLLW
jgi:hypothetical protein